MAQKICPKCSQGMGPRSKSCPKCGYEYPHLQNGSSKNDDDDDSNDGTETKTRSERKSCFNCGIMIESINSNIDSYGKVIYHYRYDNYCGTNCMLVSLEVRDNLILEILNKIKDYNNEDLTSFIEDRKKIGIYDDVIQTIEANALTESENAEYYKMHSKIPSKRNIAPYSLTTARDNALIRGDFTLVRIINEKLGNSEDDSNLNGNSSIDESEKAGIRIPPKIGSYVPKEPEEEINPFKALLLGIKPVIKNDEEEEEKEEPTPPKPLSIAELFAKSSPKPLVPTTPFKFVTPVIPVTPTISNPISNSYDSISRPTQGQRKCGAKDRAKGLMVGCGKINGVRQKQCSCGYVFP